MKKRMIAILAGVAATSMLMTGCGGNVSDKGEEGVYKIGISQFAEHGSLDDCREGFLEGLKEEGIEEGKNLEVDYKNSASDQGTAAQIAQGFVADDVDMICAIATSSAQAAFNASMDKNTPVIYTAITDPVAAELATEDGESVGEITGTSDMLPVEEQLKMIREILPDAKTIGILYTTSEPNSESAIKVYEKYAEKYGFEIKTSGISTTAEIPLAADSLLSKVDCLTNLTDNTVVSSLPTILEKANAKKIPVFGSEIQQVKQGCLGAAGLDYVELGKQTGKMAAKVLKGEKKASEMKYETISESFLYLNTETAENLGITLPEELKSKAKEVFEEISTDQN